MSAENQGAGDIPAPSQDDAALQAKLDQTLKVGGVGPEAVDRLIVDFNAVAIHFVQSVSSQVERYEFLSARLSEANGTAAARPKKFFIDPLEPKLRQPSPWEMAVNLLLEMKLEAVQGRLNPDTHRERFMAEYLRFDKTVKANGIHGEVLDRLTQTLKKHWSIVGWPRHDKSERQARQSAAKASAQTNAKTNAASADTRQKAVARYVRGRKKSAPVAAPAGAAHDGDER